MSGNVPGGPLTWYAYLADQRGHVVSVVGFTPDRDAFVGKVTLELHSVLAFELDVLKSEVQGLPYKKEVIVNVVFSLFRFARCPSKIPSPGLRTGQPAEGAQYIWTLKCCLEL